MKHKAIQLDPRKLLVSGQYQARKMASQTPLSQLADSIAEVGLLHALAVVKSKKRGFHEVIAGGRRTKAIQLLMEDGRWSEGQLVDCNLYSDENALLISITENVQREQMHPADEFESFAALIDQGKTIEDVAAAFGVTATVVRRRLQLGRVSPSLMQAYRANDLSLDALMAYAVTDDQKRQEQVYASLDMWDRKNPRVIRRYLIDEALTASHRLVRFIGLVAYETAGGGVTKDLFADEDDLDGIYLTDRGLVEQLAMAKLQENADLLKQEGWSWVEITLETESVKSRFGRVNAQPVELTHEIQAAYDSLNAQVEQLSETMSDLEEEGGDEAEWQKLDEQRDDLYRQIAGFEDLGHEFTSAQKKIAGCMVSVDFRGELGVVAGLIRPEDRVQAQELQEQYPGSKQDSGHVSLPAVKTRPMHSERLVRQLTANKTAIVQAVLANSPNVALAVLVAQMAQRHFGDSYCRHESFGLGISTSCEALETHAPDLPNSRAGQELARIAQHWGDVVPGAGGAAEGAALSWALAQDTDTLLELLAYLVATTVQGVQCQESNRATALDRLAGLLNVSMSDWWSATSETYLSHVSKDRLVEVVSAEAAPEQAALLVRMKKDEASQAAEQALAGKGWLPKVMQIAD
ncbi:ParB/RepB/Spo0J family partition protein [Alcaligenes phenolicus]|uniref:ParB/RepB/Spo0J family partition protein n=1 Tax=Alcaligenes TaxID=507 RepID=UPI002AA3902C|nr:ParB/RepB/Spo0J family partition protein [Alcaligenes phenolicus]MDK7585095.1 ParB/RepB/Spo0J family partition protein [Alcaligenes phenolicus]